LILSTNAIGGAEKRFAGLWQSINQEPRLVNIFLVCSSMLLCDLKKQENLGVLFESGSKVIEHDFSGGFKQFRKATHAFIHRYGRKGDVLHFIGDHPLAVFPDYKVIFSITQSSFKNLNLYGRLGQFGGVLFSNLIDILDPTIYQYLKSVFFWKQRRISLTSNSYCNTTLFSSVPYEEKKDWFVFLGRFEKMKQVATLLNAIPSLYQTLQEGATNDLHFYFLGHGSLEGELRQMLLETRFRQVPVTIEYLSQPHEVLKQSKYFFSLQLHNNYPSKSLLEAMASGNIPIVTDVGQTRWLAKPEFSYYVPESFTEEDLCKTVTEVFEQEQSVLASKAAMASAFVAKEHTIEKMRDYYLNLYRRV